MAEKTAPRARVGGRNIEAYQMAKALEMVEKVAEGMTLKEVSELPGMPTRVTFYRWLTLYPAVKQAYDAAKELSGTSLEEEALGVARLLTAPNQYTPQQVSAFRAAMEQFRWSAERRDPSNYGQKGNNVSVMVPVQINTTLDLGPGGGAAMGVRGPGFDNVFQFTVKPAPDVQEPVQADVQEAEQASALPAPSGSPLDLPEKVTHNLTRKRGRPPGKGKWKTPQQTAASVGVYKARDARKKAKAEAAAQKETEDGR